MLSARYSYLFFLIFFISCSGFENSQDLSEFVEEKTDSDSLQIETRVSQINSQLSLSPWRISPYDHIIKKYSRRYGFDWRLIAAQIFVESRFEIRARSGKGAIGLMQVMPATARYLGADVPKLLLPEQNIALGCFYDRKLFQLWKDKEGINRLAFTLASYNAGRRRILRAENKAGKTGYWSKVKNFAPLETRKYVGRIFGKYAEYKKKHF